MLISIFLTQNVVLKHYFVIKARMLGCLKLKKNLKGNHSYYSLVDHLQEQKIKKYP